MFDDAPLPAARGEYEARILHEAEQLAERAARAGLPRPFGDPLSGIVLVAEAQEASARMTDALRRSLAAVRLDAAYVTWASAYLLDEILSLEPTALVAIGPDAARAIDSASYPLAKGSFAEAGEGEWFAFAEGALGLRRPALGAALRDADAKKHFWRAFLALRALAPDSAHKRSRPRP